VGAIERLEPGGTSGTALPVVASNRELLSKVLTKVGPHRELAEVVDSAETGGIHQPRTQRPTPATSISREGWGATLKTGSSIQYLSNVGPGRGRSRLSAA